MPKGTAAVLVVHVPKSVPTAWLFNSMKICFGLLFRRRGWDVHSVSCRERTSLAVRPCRISIVSAARTVIGLPAEFFYATRKREQKFFALRSFVTRTAFLPDLLQMDTHRSLPSGLPRAGGGTPANRICSVGKDNWEDDLAQAGNPSSKLGSSGPI